MSTKWIQGFNFLFLGFSSFAFTQLLFLEVLHEQKELKSGRLITLLDVH